MGHIGMKLQRERRAAIAEGLHGKRVPFRQQVRAKRQIEALPVPLIHLLGPRIADAASNIGRLDGIITDLGMAVGVLVDPTAEVMRQHLRPEADAEKRLVLPQRNCEPVDFPADEIIFVIRAHGAAENDGTGMLPERVRQGIAEARAPHIQCIATLTQRMAYSTWSGGFLMHHDENGIRHACSVKRVHRVQWPTPTLRSRLSFAHPPCRSYRYVMFCRHFEWHG